MFGNGVSSDLYPIGDDHLLDGLNTLCGDGDISSQVFGPNRLDLVYDSAQRQRVYEGEFSMFQEW